MNVTSELLFGAVPEVKLAWKVQPVILSVTNTLQGVLSFLIIKQDLKVLVNCFKKSLSESIQSSSSRWAAGKSRAFQAVFLSTDISLGFLGSGTWCCVCFPSLSNGLC